MQIPISNRKEKQFKTDQLTSLALDNRCATAATTAAPQPDPSSAKRKFTSVVGRNSSKAWFINRLNVGCFLYKVPSIATLTDGFLKRYKKRSFQSQIIRKKREKNL